MRRTSGYVDGLGSGATWGVVAILLPGLDRLSGASMPALSVAVAAFFAAAAALFLLIRSALAGSLVDVAYVLFSKRALGVAACSLLGGRCSWAGTSPQ